jgi:hypothetical protein
MLYIKNVSWDNQIKKPIMIDSLIPYLKNLLIRRSLQLKIPNIKVSKLPNMLKLIWLPFLDIDDSSKLLNSCGTEVRSILFTNDLIFLVKRL